MRSLRIGASGKRRVLFAAASITLVGAGWIMPAPRLVATAAEVATSPLQASGLVPLWQEDMAGGSLQRMQYSWASGVNSALDSRVIPGAAYLGQNGSGTEQVEQQLNNFKESADEPVPNTIEFDVRNPLPGESRVSLRAFRRYDMATIRMGLTDDRTVANLRFPTPVSLAYDEKTGPSRGWTHVTASYRQFLSDGTTYAHYVIAFNEEVREHIGPSGNVNPDWETHWSSTLFADAWSIEVWSPTNPMGKWLANIRGYDEFLTLAEMSNRLAGRVAAYRAGLPDPSQYAGPSKAFQLDQPLTLYGPNAIAYADVIGGTQVRFDGSLSSSWGKITSYSWSLGDGSTGSGRTLTHVYPQAGTYTARLTVTSKYGSNTRELAVTVAPPANSPPVARDDGASTAEDVAVDVEVLANDTDADGDPLSLSEFSDGASGTVSEGPSGILTYTPNANTSGVDTFSYVASDGRGGSAAATVTVTVAAINDPPVVVEPGDQSSAEGAAVTLAVSASDVDGDALGYSATGLPPGLTMDPATGVISGVVGAGASAGSPYATTLAAFDPSGATDTASFLWTISATSPAAPSGLRASFSSISLDLDWDDGPSTISGYNVYRAESATGTYTKLNAAPVVVSGFTDSTAPIAATSHYRVTAVAADGRESPPAEIAASRPIGFVASSSGTVKPATMISVPRPTAVRAGDVLLAAVTVAGSPTVTPPAGWLTLAEHAAGTGLRQIVYARTATENEPSAYIWTLSARAGAVGAIAAYRGGSPSGAIDAVAGQANAAAKLITAPSTTTTVAPTILVAFFGIASTTSITPPDAMIEQMEVKQGPAKLTLQASDQVLAAAGPTGARTATAGNSAISIGQVVALRTDP